MNNFDNDDISVLLDELSGFNPQKPSAKAFSRPEEENNLTEQDARQYFLNKTKAIIDAGVGAIQDITPYVVSGNDSREIESLSKLLQSTATALDVLNKTNLIDKKADRDEQLEKLKLEGKKELAQLKQGPQNITTNNILVASREEIMKKLSLGKDGVLDIAP